MPVAEEKCIHPFELLRCFMEFCVDKGKTSFPPLYTGARPWHELLYAMKDNLLPRFTELYCVSKFDWDGPHPTSRRWREIQSCFSVSGICHLRGGSPRVYLYLDKKQENNPFNTNRELLEEMFNIASGIEGFFED